MGLTIIFEVNFMDSNMIPWFISLNNLTIWNILWSLVPYSAHSTQSGAGQWDACSKTSIIAEWSINVI